MSICRAEPNDIYIDEDGKFWRVVAICGEPTVTVEEIDHPDGKPRRMTGATSGLMWHGFRKLVPEADT